MASKIHLCFVAYEYLPRFSTATALLDDLFSLTDVAEALQELGCKLSAVVRFTENVTLKRNGVEYHFVSDRFGPQLKFWELPRVVHESVKALNPDVVHTHNMNKVLQHNHLANTLDVRIPILVQNHAEWPAKWLRIRLQQLYFPKLSAFVFCAPGQEQRWLSQRAIRDPDRIHFVMEGSTHFISASRPEARLKTGLNGDPVFLWVGNLNENKDPLTVLDAFESLLSDRPKAKLYLIYRYDELLIAVRERIQKSEHLRGRVELLGKKDRTELEYYYNSANYFVLGSHQEGSGYSLMEALACGCVPIVTDIPSFRMMTDQGALGALWKVGDSGSALAAIQRTLTLPWEKQSRAARAYFEAQLSNEAIARQLLKIYQGLIEEKRS